MSTKRFVDGIAVIIVAAAAVSITSVMIETSGIGTVVWIYTLAGVIAWALIRTIGIRR